MENPDSTISPAGFAGGMGCTSARDAGFRGGRIWTKRSIPKGYISGIMFYILRDAMVLSHDACRGIIADTRIEDNCVIGVRSIVLPGITIGPDSIGAGSVVTKTPPPNSIVAGNPARVIRTGISVRGGKISSDHV